jgi:sugar lactone lactonase YvrE
MPEIGIELTILLTDIAMGESARWHDGRFWCSDWVAGEILAAEVAGPRAGEREVVARSTSFPFCFDWLPDGRMLVTGARGLERLAPDGLLVPHVDLTGLSIYGWNEVIVDGRGNAYVNNVNFEVGSEPDFEVGSTTGLIALVTPEGDARLVAEGLAFPNGMALTPDGSTLVVAESFASRLAAFDIDVDGGLSNRRVWAEVAADGISVDAEGAIWCASQDACLRVPDGGEVLQRVPLDRAGFSCALGGPNGTTLYIVANEWKGFDKIGKGPRAGRVYSVEVEVPAPAAYAATRPRAPQ